MSLALATLIHEWRRYLAAVLALAFSGVLILTMVGLMVSLVQSLTSTLVNSRADLVIMPPRMESMIGSFDILLPRRIAPRIYLSSDVEGLGSWEQSGASWQNIPGPGRPLRQVYVRVSVVDPGPGSVTLPRDFDETTRAALEAPLSVVVDESALESLGSRVGETVLLNGRTTLVGAAVRGYGSIDAPNVFVSRDNMIQLGLMGDTDQTGPLLVRLKDSASAERARDDLNARAKGDYRAWRVSDLARANEFAFLQQQIVGVFLIFSVLLSLLIGTGITSQTLRGAIASNIREFASLRALGISMSALRGVVMELAFWVGIAGLAATAVLMGGVIGLASLMNLSLSLNLPVIAPVVVLLMAISLVSGFLSLGALSRSQPAELLR